MKQNITSLICLIAFALTTNAQTDKFLAGGISFEGPKGWQSQKPGSDQALQGEALGVHQRHTEQLVIRP